MSRETICACDNPLTFFAVTITPEIPSRTSSTANTDMDLTHDFLPNELSLWQ
jgi:hypothetical protein